MINNQKDESWPPTQSETPAWLQLLDHTADTGIIVQASNARELYARCAWAMFSIIADPQAVRENIKTEVSVEAIDPLSLMVRWLSELNFQHVTRHELYCRFKILELSDNKLLAEVHGEHIDLSRHTVFTEIKAVTFHGLQLDQVNDGWKAQIIFDI